jgi:ferrochelatase
VPVSFVSEHSETLYEIDILYRELAAEIGLPDYRRVSTFNCRPEFIEVLANLVEREISEGRS